MFAKLENYFDKEKLYSIFFTYNEPKLKKNVYIRKNIDKIKSNK